MYQLKCAMNPCEKSDNWGQPAAAQTDDYRQVEHTFNRFPEHHMLK